MRLRRFLACILIAVFFAPGCVEDEFIDCSRSVGLCPYAVSGKLVLETQTVYYDAYKVPMLDKKLDIPGGRIPMSLRDGSGKELARTMTAADGSFVMPVGRRPAATDWISIVPVWYVSGKPKVAIARDGADDDFNFWAWSIRLSNFSHEGDLGNLGDVRISIEQASGALYLFQIIVRAYEDLVRNGFAYDLARLPSMSVAWTPGRTWPCGTCYIKDSFLLGGYEFDTTMLVGGSPHDESAWGYPTILHEFGHYVLFQKRDDTVGGTHYLNGTSDPRLAWSEGWATFFALKMMSFRSRELVSRYWRVLHNGSYWLDYAHLYDGGQNGYLTVPQPVSSNGMFQKIGEAWITYMLLNFWDGSDFEDIAQPADEVAISARRIFGAIAGRRYLEPESYFRASRCPADGDEMIACRDSVHFVHFVDALLCGASADEAVSVSDLLIQNNYPYDRSPVCEVR